MILFVIGAILLGIYLWFKKKFSFWERHGFPFIPAKVPFGSVGEMGFSAHSSDVMKKFYDANRGKAPGVGMYFMTQPAFLPTEPELVKDILQRNFEYFHDRGFFVNEKADPLSAHLFMLSGQEWKDLRAKLSPTFTSGKIKMMFDTVSTVCDRMVAFIEPEAKAQQNVEMKEILSSSTTEVICNVAFGLDTECLGNPNNEFRKVAHAVFNPPYRESLKFLFMNAFQDISRTLGLSINTKETTDFFLGVIKSSISHREANNIKRNDFLQLLMNIKNSELGMTMNEIAANSFVFFLAGFETSSSVATFTLYELALNQDIQEKLRDEIEEITAKHDGKVTYESILEMKYLDMVFNESMRKYPVVDNQFRMCSKDFNVPNTNYTIPKDAFIVVSAHALHYDDRFWENPHKFDPERFTDENVKNRHPFAYIPFSEGPRICIGSRFGIMQTKLALIKLLQKYKFSPCEKTTIPMKFVPSAVVQSPVGGMWLKVESIH